MLFGVLVILMIIGLYGSLHFLIVKGSRNVDEQKYSEAIQSYEWALKLLNVPLFYKKTKADVLSGMGYAWSEMGEYEKAINSYERALQIDANYVPALAGMGDVYFELGLYEKTIALYDKVISLSPEGRGSYYQRGKAYKEKGSYCEALQDFHRAIRIAPNDLDTMKEISGVLLKMGLKSEDAIAMNLQKEGFNETEIKAVIQLKDH